MTKKCVFPFIYNGLKYKACTSTNKSAPWCSILVDENGHHIEGEDNWGFCGKDCPIDNYDGKILIDF